MQVIERAAWRYEAQDEGFGRVYRWYPGYVVIECECGERLSLTVSTAACPRCGANHAATVREELTAGQLQDQALHPWRYDARNLEDTGLPC